MKKQLSAGFIFLIVATLSFSAKAQIINGDSIKNQLLKDWQRAKDYSIEYLNTMPADKYAARPVDSIRSFSEQMLHLAMGNVSLASNGVGKERIFGARNLEKAAGAQSKDSVAYFVTASYDYVINGIKSLDVSKFGEIVKRGNFELTRLTWIMKAFEHQTHHRGQCTIYIRLQGIRPPNERLF
jgi:uncharacterized damage-inducible protein DinB